MAPAQLRMRAGEARLHVVKNEKDRPSPSPKVLRIGVVESGRIVDEKIIGQEKEVSIGHSERNDFVLFHDSLPARHTLFEYRGGAYYLNFTEDMTGRVTFPGGFSELSVLASSGKVKRRGRTRLLELGEDSRGKVTIGESTLLFQMVNRPATQPKPKLPATVRSGWLKSIDWFFATLVLASFLAQFGLVVYLVQRDWPLVPNFELRANLRELLDSTRPSQVDIDARLQDMQNPDTPRVVDLPPELTEQLPTQLPAHRPAKQPSSVERAEAAAAARASAAERERRVKAALDSETARLLGSTAILGSLNKNADGAVADVLRGGRITDDLDGVLAGLDGVAVASNDSKTVFRRPSGRGVGTDAVNIAGLIGAGSSGGRDVQSEGVGEEAPISGRIKRGRPAPSPTSRGILNEGEVRRVVGGALSAIKMCYERSLRRNRSLQGRVSINFTIGTGGRVTRAQAVQNLAAAPEVGSCIENRFRSLRFPSPDGGAVTFQYPFLFEPSH